MASEEMNIAHLLRHVRVGEETVYDVVLGENGGQKLTVEMRRLLPEAPREPVRAPSPARKHVFHSTRGVENYVRSFIDGAADGGSIAVMYCDIAACKVSIVTEEEAERGYEVLTFVPQVHPRWAPWEEKIGKDMPIKDLVSFLRQNRKAIIQPDGRDLAGILGQVRMSKSVILDVGAGRKCANGLTVETEIGGRKGSEKLDIPETIIVRSPIFVEEPADDIAIDLILEAAPGNEAGIVARFSSADLREARIFGFERICTRLEKVCAETGVTFTHGSPAWQPWETLREIQA